MPQRKDGFGNLLCFPEYDGPAQEVAIGAASAQSAALNALTTSVVLTSNVACRIAYGLNPTALTTSALLPANYPFPVSAIGGMKFAVIQETGAGKLSIQECT